MDLPSKKQQYTANCNIYGMSCGSCAKKIKCKLEEGFVKDFDKSSLDCHIDYLTGLTTLTAHLPASESPDILITVKDWVVEIVSGLGFTVSTFDFAPPPSSNVRKYQFCISKEFDADLLTPFLKHHAAVKSFSISGTILSVELDIDLVKPKDFYERLHLNFPKACISYYHRSLMDEGISESRALIKKHIFRMGFHCIFLAALLLLHLFKQNGAFMIFQIFGLIVNITLYGQNLKQGMKDVYNGTVSLFSFLAAFSCIIFIQSLCYAYIYNSAISLVDLSLLFCFFQYNLLVLESMKFRSLRACSNEFILQECPDYLYFYLVPGDIVELLPGSKVPIDCVCPDTSLWVDEAWLTGESKPVVKRKDDIILKDSVILSQEPILAHVACFFEDSFSRRLINCKNVSSFGPVTTEFDVLSKTFFLGCLSVGFLITFVYSFLLFFHRATPAITSIIRIIELLLFSLSSCCPCIITLVPCIIRRISFSYASQRGVYMQSSSAFAKIPNNAIFLFDKTGTLTETDLRIIQFSKFDGFNVTEDFELIEVCERRACPFHPIGISIRNYCALKKTGMLPVKYNINIEDIIYIAGKGITFHYDGNEYLLGSYSLLKENNISIPSLATTTTTYTSVYYVKNSSLIGWFEIDTCTIAEGISEMIQGLQARGHPVGIISGDTEKSVKLVAERLNLPLENVFWEAMPSKKADILMDIRSGSISLSSKLAQKSSKAYVPLYSEKFVIMVGDGINDSLAFKEASLSIALVSQKGSAFMAADVYLSTVRALSKPTFEASPEFSCRFSEYLRLTEKIYETTVLSFLLVLVVNTVALGLLVWYDLTDHAHHKFVCIQSINILPLVFVELFVKLHLNRS